MADFKRALYIHADVASWDSQVSLFRQALAYFPNNEIDILVTSAGIGRQYLDSTPQSYQNLDSNVKPWSTKDFEVNLIGTYHTI